MITPIRYLVDFKVSYLVAGRGQANVGGAVFNVESEAARLKREGDSVAALDSMGVTSDDTDAYVLVGGSFDTADALASIFMLEVTDTKLYEGDVAIIAPASEEGPAFDAPSRAMRPPSSVTSPSTL
jgi:hypothetical protein